MLQKQKDYFYGTGISLFQFTNSTFTGDSNILTAFDDTTCQSQTFNPLPESYTIITSAILTDKEHTIPETNAKLILDTGSETGTKQEVEWLGHVEKAVADTYDGRFNLSWSAFHADRETQKDILPSLTALLPLFEEQSKSVR